LLALPDGVGRAGLLAAPAALRPADFVRGFSETTAMLS
jgi:hypothetical protein